MRRVLIVFTLFVLWIAACAPTSAPTEEASETSDQPSSTSTPVPTDPSTEASPTGPTEEAAIEQLAENLGLEEGDITVVSSEATEFGDSCLGITMEGVMCAQVVTPGRIIMLEANDIQYEYHTDEDGSQIQPASLAVVWKREGGIAGFCDMLMVFRSGEVLASKCQAEGATGTFAELLTSREMQQFQDWLIEFDETKLDSSDPKGVSDRMVVTMDFYGLGSKAPAESEQQVLFNFAQDLYQELSR